MIKLKNLFVRPSTVLRDIENGFVGAAHLVQDVAHAAKIEYKARKIADAMSMAKRLRDEQSAADVEEISVRLGELMAARAARKAA